VTDIVMSFFQGVRRSVSVLEKFLERFLVVCCEFSDNKGEKEHTTMRF
jgi:hypothetical protein